MLVWFVTTPGCDSNSDRSGGGLGGGGGCGPLGGSHALLVISSLRWNVNGGAHQPFHLAGGAHEEPLVEPQAHGHSGGIQLQLGPFCRAGTRAQGLQVIYSSSQCSPHCNLCDLLWMNPCTKVCYVRLV